MTTRALEDFGSPRSDFDQMTTALASHLGALSARQQNYIDVFCADARASEYRRTPPVIRLA